MSIIKRVFVGLLVLLMPLFIFGSLFHQSTGGVTTPSMLYNYARDNFEFDFINFKDDFGSLIEDFDKINWSFPDINFGIENFFNAFYYFIQIIVRLTKFIIYLVKYIGIGLYRVIDILYFFLFE